MREIKYRARVLNSKNWIYRQPFHIRGTWYMYNSLWDMVPIEPNTIGQYMGLKDRSSKEIYEGDVVQYRDNKPYEIAWDDINAQFYLKRGNYGALEMNADLHEYLVIGNIHDNPELLEHGQSS